MKKKKPTKKPSPIALGDGINLRAQRGPNKQGLYYWSAIYYDTETQKERRIYSAWDTPGAITVEVERRKATGNLFQKEEKPQSQPTTVAELLDKWVEFRNQEPNTSKETKKRCFWTAKYVKQRLGNITLTKVDAALLEDWRNHFLNDYAEHNFNTTLKGFKNAWKWGSRRGWVSTPELPLSMIDADEEYEKFTPSDHDMERLFANLKGAEWAICALKVCKELGLRNGELVSLTWDKIDFQQKKLTVCGKTDSRTVPMSKALLQVLKDWKEKEVDSDWKNIFGMSPYTIKRYLNMILKPASERAMIEHRITVHSIRRWFIYRLRKAKVNVKVAAEIVGHSVQTMMSLYSDISFDEKADAMAEMEKLNEAASVPESTPVSPDETPHQTGI